MKPTMVRQRILVGNSVYEEATLTLDGTQRLFIEFDTEDLDDLALDVQWLVERPIGEET
jgi:hypothetical protein